VKQAKDKSMIIIMSKQAVWPLTTPVTKMQSMPEGYYHRGETLYYIGRPRLYDGGSVNYLYRTEDKEERDFVFDAIKKAIINGDNIINVENYKKEYEDAKNH
jgi:hypothetical protein